MMDRAGRRAGLAQDEAGQQRRCRWWFYHNASSSSRLNIAGRKIKVVCRDLDQVVVASNTTRAGR